MASINSGDENSDKSEAGMKRGSFQYPVQLNASSRVKSQYMATPMFVNGSSLKGVSLGDRASWCAAQPGLHTTDIRLPTSPRGKRADAKVESAIIN